MSAFDDDAYETKYECYEAGLDAGEPIRDALRVSLAASQAECVALREALRGPRFVSDDDLSCAECGALMNLPDGFDQTAECNPCAQSILREAREALSTPTDTSALRAMLEKAWRYGYAAVPSVGHSSPDNIARDCAADMDSILTGGSDA